MGIVRKLSGLAVATALVVLTAADARGVTIFSQDFEVALGASEVATGDFSINSTGIMVDQTRSMGHAAEYANNESSSYTIFNLDLGGFTSASLQFDFSIDIEVFFDSFSVLGPSGAVLPAFPGSDLDSGSNSGLRAGTALFDLSGFVGGTLSEISFRFESDLSVTELGVSIDNVVIEAVPEPSTVLLLAGALAALAALRPNRIKTPNHGDRRTSW